MRARLTCRRHALIALAWLALLVAPLVSADERDVSALRPGVFLYASPELRGSIFESSVIVLVHHEASGSMGLIVNRPTDVSASVVRQSIPGAGSLEGPLHVGGPVMPASVSVLLWRERPVVGGAVVTRDIHFVSNAEALSRLLRSTHDASRMRVFVGYAGWGAGQLADEVRRDSWVVTPATAAKIFLADPSSLWREVFALQRRVEARRASGVPQSDH